jgi:Tol biopolymer transport system component
MSYTGEIHNISIPVDKPISSPMFHPDGDRGLVIKGNYDTDLVSVNLTDNTSHIIFRSNTAEKNAVYHPNGASIAFESKRSGNSQVWIANQNTTTQLSDFPTDTYITGIKWSNDGKSIMASANSSLFKITLEQVETEIKTNLPILTLLHWYESQNTALVFAQFNGLKKLAEVDLVTGRVHKLSDMRVNWASKTKQGTIVLTDHMDQFWVSSGIEYQPITALEKQGGNNKRFFIKDNKIYGLSNQNQVWRYNLQTKTLETIRTLTINIENINDIKNNNLLITERLISNKEVVELQLKE